MSTSGRIMEYVDLESNVSRDCMYRRDLDVCDDSSKLEI